MKRIDFIKNDGAKGESARLFEEKRQNGFWKKYIRCGTVIDFGYKGGANFPPLFKGAQGLDLETPGYDGKNFPFLDNTIGTILASHVLKYLADYGLFFRECIRCLSKYGTLIISVPLKDTYERKQTPPSHFNPEHKRFYTAATLLYEIENSIKIQHYLILYLENHLNTSYFHLIPKKQTICAYEIKSF